MPANRVRIIVPHLGGGFGGKCGFHFEAHVAALARAARRPVRLVFTRREEFLAPDRRREGMVVELETGVRRDGTITARRAWLALDNGAYTADAGFFSQIAVMHALGPYQIPNVKGEAHLVYTNHQPSGSVRAPTAPQACWAVETHTDEVAKAVGIDPANPRKLLVAEEGSGLFTNAPKGTARDLYTLRGFGDVAVEIEFLIPQKSNSGVKMMGLYEIQITDSFGKAKLTGSDSGGIYPRAELLPKYRHLDEGIAPKTNACGKPGD